MAILDRLSLSETIGLIPGGSYVAVNVHARIVVYCGRANDPLAGFAAVDLRDPTAGATGVVPAVPPSGPIRIKEMTAVFCPLNFVPPDVFQDRRS
jgi:hypothetical protein